MRQLLLIGALAGLATTAQAQAWETSAHLTGGGFNFRGASAERASILNMYRTNVVSPTGSTGYTNNPYGARPGLSYGVALQQQRVTKGRLLLGLQAGYERLRSRS
ncbi:hypothetical protein EJV47_21360 [Hymenobacter gummosus]|uniref:Outer membrane protein beta-barrel domain-containing protein n=1 Tax=Hymenobacter gummosus TaxID=1776032 RepID=A0A3S0QFD3_9BACT|nr:hypothetical protein [Hymenobacter gummosus]RTQ46505.1 hypothetical protein EJV47_21360 [Hymenobacter gummosus]